MPAATLQSDTPVQSSVGPVDWKTSFVPQPVGTYYNQETVTGINITMVSNMQVPVQSLTVPSAQSAPSQHGHVMSHLYSQPPPLIGPYNIAGPTVQHIQKNEVLPVSTQDPHLVLVTDPSASVLPAHNIQPTLYVTAPPPQLAAVPNHGLTLHSSAAALQPMMPIHVPPPTLVTAFSTAQANLLPVQSQSSGVYSSISVPANSAPTLYAAPPQSTPISLSVSGPPPVIVPSLPVSQSTAVYGNTIGPANVVYGQMPVPPQPAMSVSQDINMYGSAMPLPSTITQSEVGMYGPISTASSKQQKAEEYDPAAPTDDLEGKVFCCL